MILRHGYQSTWIDDLHSDSCSDNTLLQAVEQQKSLGAHSLPLGYLSTLWNTTQTTWLKATNTNPKGTDWTNEMITILHTYTYSIWKEQNNILHNDSEKSEKILTRQKL